MNDIRKLLSKLYEEQSLAEEQANINQASKEALKNTVGTTTTSQLKASVAEDPMKEIEKHLLAAYQIMKKNPQLKLGKITTQIKAYYAQKEQTVATVPATEAVPMPAKGAAK